MSQQLPAVLISSLQNAPGFDAAAFTAAHESGVQVTSIRINPEKFDAAQTLLKPGKPVPWSSTGYYLEERPSFTLDPMFHAGAYYVQEASSMFLEEAIRQSCNVDASIRALDLCAAPGGKSTLMQSVLSRKSLLVSNEAINPRANILSENMAKWGAENVVITNNDPKDFQRLPGYFDLVVVDAPCSGSGLFRKDPAAIGEWSPDNVMLCSQRQQRILADALPALKPGGTLIYSTCSYSMEEDEHICSWLTGDQKMGGVKLEIKSGWRIIESAEAGNWYGYRFYPDRLDGEGFFIAVFKKPEGAQEPVKVKITSKPVTASKETAAVLSRHIKEGNTMTFLYRNGGYLAFPQHLFSDLLLLQSALYLKKAGIKMGAVIRHELIPDHDLVISNILSDIIPVVDADLSTALDYLRRKDIVISDATKGWMVLRFNGLALGLIKVLPKRINNYYPKEWRILNK